MVIQKEMGKIFPRLTRPLRRKWGLPTDILACLHLQTKILARKAVRQSVLTVLLVPGHFITDLKTPPYRGTSKRNLSP